MDSDFIICHKTMNYHATRTILYVYSFSLVIASVQVFFVIASVKVQTFELKQVMMVYNSVVICILNINCAGPAVHVICEIKQSVDEDGRHSKTIAYFPLAFYHIFYFLIL